MLTFERAKFLFSYDQETGKLFWAKRPRGANRIKPGDEVGNLFCRGRYRQCSVDKEKILVHRIIWLLHHGSFPDGFIDHIDGNGINNRINNLRDVSVDENSRNQKRRSDNSSGHTGVSWHAKARKWIAQIQVKGKNIYLGLYADKESAIKARAEASSRFCFHANHGNR